MDERRAGFTHDSSAGRLTSDLGWFTERDFAAIALDRAQLHLRRIIGHHDVGGNAANPRGAGDGGGMITGRVRRHALTRSGVVEREHGVRGAAGLERADFLEILALEKKRSAEDAVEAGAR